MIDVIDTKQFTSYTNKDFESIYVELLDLVKELTYKWDPSISNESDPGVILLKLNAIIADKCNYNIDQNVLECFPLSVTQETNARQLFEQLGYFMPWYKAAVTNVSMRWIDDTSGYSYTIPKFTMVSDYDDNIIYTLVGPYDGTTNDHFQVSSQKLLCDGTTTTFKAIQGIAVNYSINDDTLITPDYLDSENRLYFDDIDIAENGIFITNVNTENYTEWKKRDNLLVESLGNRYYSFGVSEDMDSCYIEFPEDILDLMGEGINITYIQTAGNYGNIAAGTIEKFYNDLTPEESTTDEPITLNADNVAMSNYASATNGSDPEDVNSAYKNYKRTVGTFNTLITLRDYMNAINESGLVSNGFVCDRTNDIQSTYKIMSIINDANQTISQIEHDTEDNPTLTAFSLKLYLLQYVENVTGVSTYNQTFDMIKNADLENVKAYVADMKAIPHDYVDIQPSTTKAAHFCYFKNKYPIDCNILTQYPLTTPEAEELVSNVRLALYEQLNAKEINFADEVTLDLVYDIISNADSRIKAAIIDNLVFNTYAVYFDGNEYKEIEISSDDIDPIDTSIIYNVDTFDSTLSYNTGTYVLYSGHRYKCVSHKDANKAWDESDWELDEIELETNETTFIHKIGIGNYEQLAFVYTKVSSKEYAWMLNEEQVDLADYGIVIATENPYLEEGDVITAEVSVKTQLRDEIYAKSVLAGTTQFFVKDEPFNYNLNQKFTKQIDNIEKIASNVDITFNNSNYQYTLKENESLQFYAPNLIDGTDYSNYVRYEYRIGTTIPANSDYQLKDNEWVILYWKEEESSLAVYKYYAYGKGNILKPSFEILASESSDALVGASLITDEMCVNIGTTTDPRIISTSDNNGDMGADLSSSVGEIRNLLSGTRKITARTVNKVTLDSTYNCYWTLNDEVNGKYRLFEANTESPSSSQSRILKTGEYFFYSSSALTDLIVLGSGTEIIRSDSSIAWEVPVSSSDVVLTNGTSALTDLWMKIPSGVSVDVIENQYLTCSAGCDIKVEIPDGSEVKNAVVTTNNANIDRTKFFESGIDTKTSAIRTYTFTFKDDSWVYTSMNVSLDTYGLSFIGSPTPGETIIVQVTADWEIKVSSEGTICERPLSDFSFSYSVDEGTTWTKLDDITLVSHDGWKMMSLLSLTLSPTDIQVLHEGQSIICDIKGSADSVIITGAAETNNTYPVALMSSLAIDVDGSGSYASIITDDTGETIYLSLYQFEQMLTDNQKGIRFYGDNNTIFDFDEDQTEKEIEFSMPAGEYIIKLSNPTSELETVNVYLDDVLLYTMYDETITDFKDSGTYYLYMQLTDINTHKLKPVISEHEDTCTLSITNCYKYTFPDGMSEDYCKKIYDLIVTLDNEKHSFDYTYEVDEDENIENPLAAKSFFKTNHIYNNFTICQLDTSGSKIYVTGKNK